MRVDGKGRGLANLAFSNSLAGVALITGSNEAVSVQGLIVTPIAGISMTIGSWAAYGPTFAAALDVELRSTILSDEERAYIGVHAVFSDGKLAVVGPQHGLSLSTAATSNVAVDGQWISGLTTGSGIPLVATVTNLGCRGILRGYSSVSVLLPVPLRVAASLSAATITTNDDPILSASEGVGVRSYVNVALQYASREDQVMNVDSRLVIDADSLDSQDLVRVDYTTEGPFLVANGPAGTTEIIIAFTHTSITTTISVTVIRTASINVIVSPCPAYPGSTVFFGGPASVECTYYCCCC